MKVLLDTCALLWWTLDPEKLSQTAASACDMISFTGGAISSISIWEIGIKAKKKNLWGQARNKFPLVAGGITPDAINRVPTFWFTLFYFGEGEKGQEKMARKPGALRGQSAGKGEKNVVFWRFRQVYWRSRQ